MLITVRLPLSGTPTSSPRASTATKPVRDRLSLRTGAWWRIAATVFQRRDSNRIDYVEPDSLGELDIFQAQESATATLTGVEKARWSGESVQGKYIAAFQFSGGTAWPLSVPRRKISSPNTRVRPSGPRMRFSNGAAQSQKHVFGRTAHRRGQSGRHECLRRVLGRFLPHTSTGRIRPVPATDQRHEHGLSGYPAGGRTETRGDCGGVETLTYSAASH